MRMPYLAIATCAIALIFCGILSVSNGRVAEKWSRFNSKQLIHATSKCKNCRSIVLLWDDHFRGLLEGHNKAFSKKSAAKYPLGEKVMMASLLQALDHLEYTYILVANEDKFMMYYNDLSARIAVVFTGNNVMIEATKNKLFDVVPRCMFLVLDFWGTMQGVKDDVIVPHFPMSQYLIPYPDNYVNTFLGFSQGACLHRAKSKDYSGLVWGKQLRYWTNQPTWAWSAYPYLKAYFPRLTLYATCADEQHFLPSDIYNLSPLSRSDFAKRLSSQHFLWGIGQPHDGPSALEALACGVPYINTVYDANVDVHKRRMSIVNGSQTAKDKSRLLFNRKSQHKYMETFSSPYVYHVIKDDVGKMMNTLRQIFANGPFEPLIPVDYKWNVYVERVERILNRRWCQRNDTKQHGVRP